MSAEKKIFTKDELEAAFKAGKEYGSDLAYAVRHGLGEISVVAPSFIPWFDKRHGMEVNLCNNLIPAKPKDLMALRGAEPSEVKWYRNGELITDQKMIEELEKIDFRINAGENQYPKYSTGIDSEGRPYEALTTERTECDSIRLPIAPGTKLEFIPHPGERKPIYPVKKFREDFLITQNAGQYGYVCPNENCKETIPPSDAHKYEPGGKCKILKGHYSQR